MMVKKKKNISDLRAKRKAEIKDKKEERKIQKLEKEFVRKRDEEIRKKEEKEKIAEEDRLIGRLYTVSIAVPGSIMDNAQSPELRAYLAGQIARACVVFQVDEIVIYDESEENEDKKSTEGEFTGVGKKGNCNVQLARILQYLECPQYLRKSFFPKHYDLQYAGILNPLDCPHHMRAEDEAKYREGVIVDRPVKSGKGSFANCGTLKLVQIDKILQPSVRVTVQMCPEEEKHKKYLQAKVVSPDYPRIKSSIYWGYTVRLASSLSRAITNCPYKDTGKYDVTIGTSERGSSVDEFKLPQFKHLLVVFGGVQGLEFALEADEDLNEFADPKDLFDNYLNTCPSQGSRTIRTEEAILVTMSALRPKYTSPM